MWNILDKKISSTVGNQLLWLLATVLITLILNRLLNHTLDKITKKIQTLKSRYNEQPMVIEKQIYKKIKKLSKKNTNKIPNPYPPGLPIKYYTDMREDGFKFTYKPLERIVQEYSETFDARLRKYFIDHPEEREKHEEQKRALAKSLEKLNNGLSTTFSSDYFNFPR